MKCSNCGTLNPEGARFCLNCGKPMSLLCSHCGTQLAPGAKFCFNCGNPTAPVSPPSDSPAANVPTPTPARQQAEDVTPDRLEQYIPGEFLRKLEAARSNRSMEGERRIVTILFCDVKGSTSMAEMLDPEEWAEIMNSAFEHLIAPVYRYEGTLARLMGDAILAFFGAPVAHEDDAQRAILAALNIMDEIGPFKEKMKRERGLDFDVRIGINTGLVVVGAVGSDLRMEYTAMGDAVNVASRMEHMAEPGTVQISGNTYKSVSTLFDFEALGEIEVRGKSEVLQAYRVLGVRKGAIPTRGIDGLSSPLVGRQRELAALEGCIDRLVSGQGQIVSLIGDAGLGKSRLMAELRKSVSSRGAGVEPEVKPRPEARAGEDAEGPTPQGIRWLEGRSLSYETTTPYAPFVDLLSECFGLASDESEPQKYTKIRDLLSELNPDYSTEGAPFIASLLGIQPQGSDIERVKYLDPPQLRGGILQAVSGLVARLATRQPLVLVFEDLHWTDPSSLELIEMLLPLTESAMLMVVALFRPQRQDASWRFHEVGSREYAHLYTEVALEPLDEQDSRTLVANLLEIEDLPEKVRLLIMRKAEGNPFFVEEVIRSLLDAKLVIREGDHWRATREIENIAVPDTLAGVITARLDRLDDQSKHVAQIAAVVGREFRFDVLSEVYEAPATLDASLATLQRRELVREKSRLPLRVFLFKHVLTQETAYASILLSKRRELHRLVAECLERVEPERVNDLAHHLLEAKEDERALPYLIEAGDRAAHAYASQEAISYYTKALDILQRVKTAALARRAYEGMGGALMLIGRMQEAADNYHAMLHYAESLNDGPMKVSAHNKMSRIAMFLGNAEEMMTHLVVSEQIAREHDDLGGLAEFYTLRCAVCNATGDFQTAEKYMGEAVEVGQALNMKEQMVFGLSHTANTQTYMTRFDDAWETAQQAWAIAEGIGDQLHMSELLGYVYPYHYMRDGDFDRAEQAAQRAYEIANRIGAPQFQWQGAFMLGTILQSRGDYERAIIYQQKASEAGVASGYSFPDTMALCALGTLYLLISAKLKDKTLNYHTEVLTRMENPLTSGWAGGVVWVELGFCALEQDDIDAADAFFQKGLNSPSPEWLLQKPRDLVGAALVALARNQLDEARRLAAEAREYAEERSMKYLYPLIRLTQGRLSAAQNDVDSALEHFNAAETLAADMKLRPIALQAQARAAHLLNTLGRRAEAATIQSKAHDTIDEMATLFTDNDMRLLFKENALQKVVQVA